MKLFDYIEMSITSGVATRRSARSAANTQVPTGSAHVIFSFKRTTKNDQESTYGTVH
jgi:hypothetical protein